MKKIVVLAALTLAAAGSWAFYPKVAEPNGYMMVIGRTAPDVSIYTVASTGETTFQIIDTKKKDYDMEIHKAEINKINELKRTGWKVTNVTSRTVPGFYEELFLLEK